MSAHKNAGKLICTLLLVASSMALSGVAQAETGWLWYDSVFAAPAKVSAPVQSAPVRRARIARSAVIAPASIPVPIRVSAASSNSDCFWCSRRVYISGLSF